MIVKVPYRDIQVPDLKTFRDISTFDNFRKIWNLDVFWSCSMIVMKFKICMFWLPVAPTSTDDDGRHN